MLIFLIDLFSDFGVFSSSPVVDKDFDVLINNQYFFLTFFFMRRNVSMPTKEHFLNNKIKKNTIYINKS